MRVSALTFLAFYVNSAIDTGRYDDLSIDVVRRGVRAGTIFEVLATRLGNDLDLSLLDDAKRAELLDEWQDMEAAIDIRKKFGIERGGLALVMAFILEGIQRRASGKV